MTPHALALRLTLREYRYEMTPDEERDAKAHGLVVVFGASDDLLEFRGAIDEERGAYNEATFYLDRKGIFPSFNELCENKDFPGLEDYFMRFPHRKEIQVFRSTQGYPWLIRTEIPHATFAILEDGARFCRGIVFRLADVAGTAPGEA